VKTRHTKIPNDLRWLPWRGFLEQAAVSDSLLTAKGPKNEYIDSTFYERQKGRRFKVLQEWATISLAVLAYLDTQPLPGGTILFLASNPVGTSQLRLDEELRQLREELERSQLRASFLLESQSATRPKDLVRAILELSPRLVHHTGQSVLRPMPVRCMRHHRKPSPDCFERRRQYIACY
jgi:hypothetical protein